MRVGQCRPGWFMSRACRCALFVALSALPGSAEPMQVTFEQATRDLGSPDAATRLRAAQMLREAAYPEAAVPLAKLVTDPEDGIRLEAIAAELNIFLAEKVVARKRLALVIEVRSPIASEVAFSRGPLALGSHPVPPEVLTALRAGAHDGRPRVALEALYAFGTLAVEPLGGARRDLLHASGPDLAALAGAAVPPLRLAAVRVIGRVFERRRGDPPVEEPVGDAVINALNDADRGMRTAAMKTLGAMRYERSVQALTDLFQHFGKGELAETALEAIAHIGHPYSSPLLASHLAGSAAMKRIAIEGLARTGDRTTVAEIEAALKGERSEAAQLAGSFAAVLLSGASIEPLGEALSRPKVREAARAYLVEVAPGRIDLFTRYAQDPDPRVRGDAVDILGLAGDPAALPLVERLTADADPEVARAADRAFVRLTSGGKPVGP
jgi:HEAT repeat protein